MSEKSFTLSSFFNVKEAIENQKDNLSKSDSFKKLKNNLDKEKKGKGIKLPAGLYQQVFMLILHQLDSLLDIDIAKDIFGGMWSKHPEIAEYADASKYPPGKTFYVPLLDHSFETEHSPVLEPSFGGKSLGEMELTIQASFAIKGALLEIRDGKIMKISLGGLGGEGLLQVAGMTLIKKEAGTIDIPGSFSLGDGIPLQNLVGENEEETEESEEEEIAAEEE